MVRSSIRNTFQISVLTAGHFFSDFYNTFLPALMPVFVSNLGLSLTAAGMLVMVYSFTSNIIQPLCGYYIDKYSGAWLLLLTIPVSGFFICYSGLAKNPAILFFLITMAGLAGSLFHPLGSSLIGRVARADNKNFAMSCFIAGGNFGVAAGPAAVIFMLLHYGIGALPWLIIPGLLLTVAFWYLGLHRTDLKSPAARTQTTSAWYKSVDLLKLNAVMGLRSWLQAAVPAFLSVWLTQIGYSPTLAGGLLTAFLLGGAFGSFIGGYFGDRYGNKASILGSLILCLPAMYIFFSTQEITWLTWAALTIGGASLQNTLPPSIVWAQKIFPANAAMTSGMMMGLSFGLGGIGAAVTGAMADVVGLQQALMWTLLPLAIAIVIAYTIPETDPEPAAVFAKR